MFDAAVKKPPAAKLKATPMTWLWLTIAVIAAIGLLIVGIVLFFPLGLLGFARERWPSLFARQTAEGAKR